MSISPTASQGPGSMVVQGSGSIMVQGWGRLVVLALCVSVCVSEITDRAVVRAHVVSCSHRLKRLPMARMFIGQDLNFFHNVEYVNELGHYPFLKLINATDQYVEHIDLSDMSRAEINELLLQKGFYKKKSMDDTVPDKYRNGPYVPRDEL